MSAPALRIAALVVTWNRLAQLQTTLTRLLAEPLDHVLVVDNASTADTALWLAAQTDPRLRVLRLPDNVGGAGGFAAGLASLAAQEDPDWTVLMDDDARPESGAITAFRRVVPGETAEVVAAAVFTPDGTICEMNRPSRNPFWHPGVLLRSLLGGGRAGFHLPDSAFSPGAPAAPVDASSFVGFFLSRAGLARGGLPDASLFIYGDDTIYSLELRRAGGRIVLHPDVRFEHDCGSLGVGLVTRPLWKVYYLARNGVRMARVAAGPLLFPAALAWYLLAWHRKGRHYPASERGLYRALVRDGVRDGLAGRMGRNDEILARCAVAAAIPGDGKDTRG